MSNQSTVLITGGTSGIGKETVIALAKQGATVIFTARTEESGVVAQQDIASQSGSSKVFFIETDLSSLKAVRSLATLVTEKYPNMNVLINNAGVMPQKRQESKDGIELNLAVNFLAPFLLTNLLIPLLKQNVPARIINVSSSMHREGYIDFSDLESKQNFDKYKAYAQSKLALLIFTKKLAKDLQGSGITVNALHPGVISTEMTMQNVRNMNPLAAFIFKRTLLSPERGADTSVYLATSPKIAQVNGEYFDKKRITSASLLADDVHLADILWNVASKMVIL